MTRFNRTYREVDGERIEGTWRPAFIRNGGIYYLTDLKIYADGVVDCGGAVTVEQFATQVRSQLVSNEYMSRFWGGSGAHGRHWVARLLEMVRAELAAERARIADLLTSA